MLTPLLAVCFSRCPAPLVQHGRLKVRTTAEQAEIQRKELQAKAQAYLKLRGAIMAKVCSPLASKARRLFCASPVLLGLLLILGQWTVLIASFTMLARGRNEAALLIRTRWR